MSEPVVSFLILFGLCYKHFCKYDTIFILSFQMGACNCTSISQIHPLDAKEFPKKKADSKRFQTWECMLYREQAYGIVELSEYEHLVAQSCNDARQILVDCPRTYPTELTHDAQQAGLSRVLTALANSFPSIGYVQGMNMLAGLVLLEAQRHHESSIDITSTPTTTTPTMDWQMIERRAFSLSRSILRNWRLEEMFLPGFPNLETAMQELAAKLQTSCPYLTECLNTAGLPLVAWSIPMFLTLFAYCCPHRESLLLLWDACALRSTLGELPFDSARVFVLPLLETHCKGIEARIPGRPPSPPRNGSEEGKQQQLLKRDPSLSDPHAVFSRLKSWEYSPGETREMIDRTFPSAASASPSSPLLLSSDAPPR